MPELATLLSFTVAAFVVVIVPGVTVSSIVSTALARGAVAAFLMEAGAQLGRFSMVVIVAMALEAVTGLMTTAFDIVKYAGAAYLAWLGIGYILKPQGVSVRAAGTATAPWRQVLSGFIVLWSNPKALIFFGAFLPQFVDPRFAAWPQVIVLGLIEMGAGLITDGGYILLAAGARSRLEGQGMIMLSRVAGVILIGAALWLALQHAA